LPAGWVLTDQKICEDVTLVKHARNEIAHKSIRRETRTALAGIGHIYVGLAIQAAVREAVHGAHGLARPSPSLPTALAARRHRFHLPAATQRASALDAGMNPRWAGASDCIATKGIVSLAMR
jgi:hypothetical protein